MKLFLGGQFSFYLPGHPRQVELALEAPQRLSELLERLGIPAPEISLVVLNGELVELQEAWVAQDDEVRLYPPVGGG
jgi:sulfur carrier protein ThiS